VKADDEILFAIVRACDDDFFFLEARGEQSLGHSFRGFRDVADGIAGVGLD